MIGRRVINAGSACSDISPAKSNRFEFITVNPGDLAGSVVPEAKPPAEAPLPPLEVADVVEPPLPAVITVNGSAAAPAADSAANPAEPHSDARTIVANLVLSLVAAILAFGSAI